MKKGAFSLIVLSLSMSAVIPAHARNVKLILAIAAAMEASDLPDRPTGSVKFFFGNQKSPEILTKFGSYVATPRTGAMSMSDEKACYGALLWTLVALEKRALQVGANAVVNIVSYYQKMKWRARLNSNVMWVMSSQRYGSRETWLRSAVNKFEAPGLIHR